MTPEVTHKVAKATNEVEFLAPPHSIEAEQSVLGGLLLDNAAWDRLGGILKEVDFYRFEYRLIFHHIVRLVAASKPADVITVFESLQASGKADESGGAEYLNALVRNTPSAANIRHYAQIIRDRSILRQLITVCNETIADAIQTRGKDRRFFRNQTYLPLSRLMSHPVSHQKRA